MYVYKFGRLVGRVDTSEETSLIFRNLWAIRFCRAVDESGGGGGS